MNNETISMNKEQMIELGDAVFSIVIENNTYNTQEVDILNKDTHTNVSLFCPEMPFNQLTEQVYIGGIKIKGVKYIVSNSAFSAIEQQNQTTIIHTEYGDSSETLRLNPLMYKTANQIIDNIIYSSVKFKFCGNGTDKYKNKFIVNILPKTNIVIIFLVDNTNHE